MVFISCRCLVGLGPQQLTLRVSDVSVQRLVWMAQELSGADATPSPVALQGVATPAARLLRFSTVSQLPPPPKGHVAPPSGPPCIEAEKPAQNPEIPKNGPFTRTFSKVRANFCPRPCDTSQEPDRNCSDELVHMNFLFWVDFLGGFSSSDCRVSREVWTSEPRSRSKGWSSYTCKCRATL